MIRRFTSSVEEKAKIKVKFDISKSKDIKSSEYSQEFDVVVSLNRSDFESVKTNILKSCNFGTEEQKKLFSMFDPKKMTFFTKCEDFYPFIREGSPIIMKNCTNFVKQVIEYLRNEESKLKEEKKNIEDSNTSDEKDSSKKKEKEEKTNSLTLLIIFNLCKNYFENDMFAEEFISYGGIKYLISFIQCISGNMRTYALQALSKAMTFESSAEYVKKNYDIIEILYIILIKSDTVNCSVYTLEILITIISQDVTKIGYLLDIMEKYSKKTKTKNFSNIVDLLSTKNKDIKAKIKTLLFINIFINFCEKQRITKLYSQLKEAGLYIELEKIAKSKDAEFQEQLTNFQKKTKIIINGSEYEVEMCRKEREELRIKCEEMEKNLEKSIEQQLIYENIVKELLKAQRYANQSNLKNGFFDPNTPIERYENLPDYEIEYDQNGIFDFKKILKNNYNEEKIIEMEKYIIKSREFEKFKIETQNLSLQADLMNKEKADIMGEELKIKTTQNENTEKINKDLKIEIELLKSKMGEFSSDLIKEIEKKEQEKKIEENKKIEEEKKEKENQTENLTNISPPVAIPPPPPPPIPFGSPNPNEPIPTKKKIILKTKLKQLLWNKIILQPENCTNRTELIWDKIKEPDIDINEIVGLFELKKKTKNLNNEEKKIIKKKFLNAKRTQVVGISIAKLPLPEIVANALKTMDNKILDHNNIDSLLSILITKEELDLYKKMGTFGDWDKGEKYLVSLNDIPFHKEKLKIWQLYYEFNELYPQIEESIQYVIPACDELKNNKYFFLILQMILSLGNILNNDTGKGQADGFSLDLLSNISGIKDSRGQSILVFICKQAHKKDNSFEGFQNQFPEMEKAVNYSMTESESIIRELESKINNIDSLMKNLTVSDDFKLKMISKLAKGKNNIETMAKNSKKNIDYYHDMIKFYGYTQKDKYYEKNELFFKMLLQFFKEVSEHMPKLEVKKEVLNTSKVIGKKVDHNQQMNLLMSQLKKRIQGQS